MKEIIRRFDEVILEKASKVSLNEIYSHLESFVKNSEMERYKENVRDML